MKFTLLENQSLIRVNVAAEYIENGGPATSDNTYLILDEKYPTSDVGFVWNEASAFFTKLFTSGEVPLFKPTGLKSMEVLGVFRVWVQQDILEKSSMRTSGYLVGLNCRARYTDDHVTAERLPKGYEHFTLNGSFISVNETVKNMFAMQRVMDEFYKAQDPSISIKGVNSIGVSGRAIIVS